ncbi:MAG: efflux RND transporter periplasmic adaptor subunit [Propionibacteriaceae bacterium]|nr:efflux RND transporter periplasmic adaptor subunit [Propionibacteriaceae bacterium]
MKKKPLIIGGVLAAAVILVAGLVILSQMMSGATRATVAAMKIETVASLKGADRQLISGSVHTAESENFYVDASKGRVNEIKVVQGSPVKKDDELYNYSNPALTIQQEKARVQLDNAKRRVTTLEKNLSTAESDLKKATAATRDQLRAQRDQVREELASARTDIKLAELDIEETNNQVAALSVRSNFDGIVEMVNEDERNAVAQGAATKPLIRVVSNLPYEVKGSLTELQRAQIHQDQPFTATSKAMPGKQWRGTISYVSTFPMASATGTEGGQANYEFVAKLETQDGLVPGNTLFLEVKATASESFQVPAAAVQRDAQGDAYVFIVQGGRLAKQVVTVGPEAEGKIDITSELDDRTEILLNPDATTTEGMEVVR